MGIFCSAKVFRVEISVVAYCFACLKNPFDIRVRPQHCHCGMMTEYPRASRIWVAAMPISGSLNSVKVSLNRTTFLLVDSDWCCFAHLENRIRASVGRSLSAAMPMALSIFLLIKLLFTALTIEANGEESILTMPMNAKILSRSE